MKILISSHAFAPSIGGIETVSALLGQEFARLNQEVRLITQTPGQAIERLPFRVLRRPSLAQLWRALSWCDIFWQNNLSLRTLWLASVRRVPTVITHQGSYCRAPAGLDFVQRLKHFVVRRNASVAISRAVADCFAVRSEIIPNPFDANLFQAGPPTASRPNDLLFVGRLVTEKGVDVLLRSLAELRGRQIFTRLTIVGSGPQSVPMENLAAELGLRESVTFVGAQRGAALAEILQQHKILVVPSIYDEPFGIVALEGIASGCAIIGSNGGGLPEAIGPCGITFPNSDAQALADAIEGLLRSPNKCAELVAAAPRHLARFRPEVIAQAYLKIFSKNLP